MALIDSHPHPRVLFVGWPEDDPELLAMAAIVPRYQIWNGAQSTVRWQDWDAVVARDAFTYGWEGSVAVLAFGVDSLPNGRTPDASLRIYSGRRHQVSVEFETNDALPNELRRLVRDDLAPWLRAQSSRPLMTCVRGPGEVPLPSTPGVGLLVAPLWFARDPDNTMIAGVFTASSGGPVLSLPFTPEHPVRWLAAALGHWGEALPEAFPQRDPWQQRPAWMTGAERGARTQIDLAESELELEVERRQSAIADMQDDLRSAQEIADTGVRRLLTSQGDLDLTPAVMAALVSLGFEVELRDEALPPGKAKQEDLRVTPPGGRTAIAEVKGYAGGAKQSDLLKISGYARTFERETGSAPERQWYICNQFLNLDPDLRPEMLAGAEDSLAVFGADGGAVIDTRQFFRLLRSFEDGLVTAEDARAALWSSPPRFVAQSPVPESTH